MSKDKDLFGFDTTPRVLTLVVVIQDHEKAEWIWNNHLDGPNRLQNNGIYVQTIAEEDQLLELDRLQEQIECNHQFVTKRSGGSPDMESSYEMVTFCKLCGKEDSE